MRRVLRPTDMQVPTDARGDVGPRGPVSGNGRTWPEPNGSGRRGSAANGSGVRVLKCV